MPSDYDFLFINIRPTPSSFSFKTVLAWYVVAWAVLVPVRARFAVSFDITWIWRRAAVLRAGVSQCVQINFLCALRARVRPATSGTLPAPAGLALFLSFNKCEGWLGMPTLCRVLVSSDALLSHCHADGFGSRAPSPRCAQFDVFQLAACGTGGSACSRDRTHS